MEDREELLLRTFSSPAPPRYAVTFQTAAQCFHASVPLARCRYVSRFGACTSLSALLSCFPEDEIKLGTRPNAHLSHLPAAGLLSIINCVHAMRTAVCPCHNTQSKACTVCVTYGFIQSPYIRKRLSVIRRFFWEQ